MTKRIILISILGILAFGGGIYFFTRIKTEVPAKVYSFSVEDVIASSIVPTDKMEEIESKNPSLYKNLNDKFAVAIEILKEGSKYDAWIDVGVISQTFGRVDLAEKIYIRATEEWAITRVAWNNLGDIYAERGEYDKALEYYTKVTTNFSNDNETYIKIFEIYAYKLKDEEKAIEYMASVLDKFKIVGNSYFLRYLADYFERTKQNDKAKSVYLELIEKDSKNRKFYEESIKSL